MQSTQDARTPGDDACAASDLDYEPTDDTSSGASLDASQEVLQEALCTATDLSLSTQAQQVVSERIERLCAHIDLLREQLQDARHHEQLLSDVTRQLVPGASLSVMLSKVLDLVTTYAEADAGSVILLDRQGQVVGQIPWVANPLIDGQPRLGASQLALCDNLLQSVVQSGEATLVADTRADERWLQPERGAGGVRSVLLIPLRRGSRMHGVMYLTHNQPVRFALSLLVALSSVADQVAAAIENTRLVEEAQRRTVHLRLVNTVSHEIGAVLDVDELLWQVARLILVTLDCYHVAIGLIEEGKLVFRSGIDHLYRPTVLPAIPLMPTEADANGILAQVVCDGSSILVADVQQDARYRPLLELPEARSELAVPLYAPARGQNGLAAAGRKRIIGVLDVRSTEVGAFTTDDQALLEALAAQVAVALENARLFTRVRAERAMQQAILDGTDDAIIVTDTEQRILFFNPAARKAFLDGAAPPPASRLAEVVDNETLLGLWDYSAEQDERYTEVPLPDGRTFYAGRTIIPGVGQVVVMRDISTLKELDKVKSDFVSTVSHDLRSPLQAIQTSAELLPRLSPLTREQTREVIHIQAIVRRMSELVQNLLDIGRIEAGIGMETQACAIDEIINSAAGSLRGLAHEKGLEFVIDVPPMLPLVVGNPVRLEQVVSNLVSNAIKFTPEGLVTISAYVANGRVHMEVIDTGVGIPLEAQANLYEKFYRVNSPETRGIPGTGLGLAIVKSIVEGCGGGIELESTHRMGSTFRVSLDICPDQGK
jgi:signal transduction histidine kinase